MASRAKLSFCDVLVRCDSSFRQLFDMTLLPQLAANKIVPKGLEKKIGVLGPARAPEILMSGLKRTTRENFIQLLRILEVHARQDMKTRKLMGIMSSHVQDMIIPGGEGSEAAAIVRRFLDMAETYNTKQSRTAETEEGKGGVTTETNTEQGGAVCFASSSLPPSGYMEGCVSDYFGQEGGVLYSPIHGIRVEMPPNSLPQHVTRCFLGIYVYPRGPFILPDGVESCSPVVWAILHPQFTFKKDVTLTIPHSALLSMDSELSVYRMAADVEDKRSPPYQLSEKVPGSECDWYHAVVKVRHFSPHRVGAEEKSKNEGGTGSDKYLRNQVQQPIFKHPPKHGVGKYLRQKSGSLEKSISVSDELAVVTSSRLSQSPQHSSPPCSHKAPNPSLATSTNVGEGLTPFVSTQSEYGSINNSYCIARCMPKDRSCTPWEAKFYVTHDHPTALWVRSI